MCISALMTLLGLWGKCSWYVCKRISSVFAKLYNFSANDTSVWFLLWPYFFRWRLNKCHCTLLQRRTSNHMWEINFERPLMGLTVSVDTFNGHHTAGWSIGVGGQGINWDINALQAIVLSSSKVIYYIGFFFIRNCLSKCYTFTFFAYTKEFTLWNLVYMVWYCNQSQTTFWDHKDKF